MRNFRMRLSSKSLFFKNKKLAHAKGLILGAVSKVNAFWVEVVSKPALEPKLGVGLQIQILEIAYYCSGLNLMPALISGPIEGFEATLKTKGKTDTG
jgi:hypothetical protein